MKVSILGIRISILLSYKDTYERIVSYIQNNPSSSVYITMNNVHTIVEGILNEDYKQIINNAFLAFPDGKPLEIVGKLKGAKEITRIFGPTFLTEALKIGQKDNVKHFFWGSSEETLNKIKVNVKKNFPNAKIVGMISPPYRSLSEEENNNYIDVINNSGADFIWIGLGAPKQERWMAENYKKINHGVMLGVGAGFDYLAGNTSHAPKWMKKFALEWMYRLIQEPHRLWKRYLVTNTLFVFYVMLDLLHLKKFK